MAETIQKLFINPPIAIARLGGSTTPQKAYRWCSHPTAQQWRNHDRARLVPRGAIGWDCRAGAADLSATPRWWSHPAVCPFFELWASVGEPGSDPTTWKDVPVTPDLLKNQGVSLNDLVIKVDAKNFRRLGGHRNPNSSSGPSHPSRSEAIILLLRLFWRSALGRSRCPPHDPCWQEHPARLIPSDEEPAATCARPKPGLDPTGEWSATGERGGDPLPIHNGARPFLWAAQDRTTAYSRRGWILRSGRCSSGISEPEGRLARRQGRRDCAQMRPRTPMTVRTLTRAIIHPWG